MDKQKKKVGLGVTGIVLGIVVSIIFCFTLVILSGILLINLAENEQIEIHTDISEYEYYMTGENAKENFKVKLGMDESIFPKRITEDMDVQDYKMIYYNPWDAQYLGYLEVAYDKDTYLQEVERLKDYESTDYMNIYGITGFPDDLTLMAINAEDSGIIYALSDNEDTIIYVEMIYCNYFMDLDYKEYIPDEYLPIGFDATSGNDYRIKKLKD